MAYWCDDRALLIDQRRLDAAQERAKRDLAGVVARKKQEAKDRYLRGEMTDTEYAPACAAFDRFLPRNA